MSDRHLDDRSITLLLRALETGRYDLSAPRDRARARMLGAFDEPPTYTGPSADAPRRSDSHTVVELDGASWRSTRGHRHGRVVALVAALSMVAFAGAIIAQRGMRSLPKAITSSDHSMSRVDASDLVPGLSFDVDDRIASVVNIEPGSITIDIEDARSDGVLVLTLVAVDEWGPALLPASVPNVGRPDSLRSWVGRSSLDVSQRMSIEMVDPTVETEAWLSTLPVSRTCGRERSCVVASSAAGEIIALSDGAVHQLVSFDFPGASPTILAHVSYRGEPRTGLIAEQILRTLRRS